MRVPGLSSYLLFVTESPQDKVKDLISPLVSKATHDSTTTQGGSSHPELVQFLLKRYAREEMSEYVHEQFSFYQQSPNQEEVAFRQKP